MEEGPSTATAPADAVPRGSTSTADPAAVPGSDAAETTAAETTAAGTAAVQAIATAATDADADADATVTTTVPTATPPTTPLGEAWRVPATEVAERALLRPVGARERRRRHRRLRRRVDARAAVHGADLVRRVQRPITGSRVVAVLSTRGGVGKTTTALLLGHTLAALRRDGVLALDANPDAGSLGHRIARSTRATAIDLLDVVDRVRDVHDLRSFATRTPSGLEVIAAGDDPRDTRAVSQADARDLLALLRTHHPLVIADCGTGVDAPVGRAVLDEADLLVLVTGPRVDATRSADHLLAWLRAHGHARSAASAVAVVNAVHPRGAVDAAAVARHLAAEVASCHLVPWDPELAVGGVVDLGYLDPATRHALVEVAASVLDAVGDDEEDGRP